MTDKCLECEHFGEHELGQLQNFLDSKSKEIDDLNEIISKKQITIINKNKAIKKLQNQKAELRQYIEFLRDYVRRKNNRVDELNEFIRQNISSDEGESNES